MQLFSVSRKVLGVENRIWSTYPLPGNFSAFSFISGTNKVFNKTADSPKYYFCSHCKTNKYSLLNPGKVGHDMGGVNAWDPCAESNFTIAYVIKNSNVTNPRENTSRKRLGIKITGAFPRNIATLRAWWEDASILVLPSIKTRCNTRIKQDIIYYVGIFA